MMCSAQQPIREEGSGACKADRAVEVSKAVRQAQAEVERLLAALAEGAELPDPEPISRAIEQLETEPQPEVESDNGNTCHRGVARDSRSARDPGTVLETSTLPEKGRAPADGSVTASEDFPNPEVLRDVKTGTRRRSASAPKPVPDNKPEREESDDRESRPAETELTSARLTGTRAEEVPAAEDGCQESQSRRPKRSEPVYLMVSSRRALVRKYGLSGFERVDAALRDLKTAIEARADLDVVITYVDHEPSLSRFGLQPVTHTNPWQVKRLIDGVDTKLGEEDRSIRYLLIVGGDGIIPFHRLPNPVEDQDSDVPSDNPYACRDANYLVPERATGRLPDGESESVAFVCNVIRSWAEAQKRRQVSKGLLTSLSAAFQKIRHSSGKGRGLGYSASIWRKASRAVFNLIGDDSSLRTSPPLTYEGFRVLDPPHFSYFNLHGIEDGPNWYGQRDALFPADYPLFPLALRPQDPSIAEHRNAVVFTEACYGANILGKNETDSIALRLLSAGALAVVGSTKVSYGSIAPPLLGADLVGRYFWEGLRATMTVGEALQHAKLTMANEMHKRQGYLDDEDQKALISFVLYGDPALSVATAPGRTSMLSSAEFLCPPIICSNKSEAKRARASEELVAKVKGRIETSMPHMSQARVRAKRLAMCTEGCAKGCRSERTGQHAKALERRPQGWTLTLQKDIAIRGDGAHHQVVKVVVDENGHIRKMVVSK